MRPWRYLTLLVLCCLLDLAVPVAPTASAAEIEQDDVVQAAMRREARPPARVARWCSRTPVRPRVRITGAGDRPLSRRLFLPAHIACREGPFTERRAAAPPLTEDA